MTDFELISIENLGEWHQYLFRQRFLAASTFRRGKVAAVSDVKSKLVVEYWNTKTTQNYIQFLKLEDKKLPSS